jgi:hypothetical protein
VALFALEKTKLDENLFNMQKEMTKNAAINTQIDGVLLNNLENESTQDIPLKINEDSIDNHITSDDYEKLQSQLDISNCQISMYKNENEELMKNYTEKLNEIDILVTSFTSKLNNHRLKESKQISDSIELQVYIHMY